jgi:hypothetical protein
MFDVSFDGECVAQFPYCSDAIGYAQDNEDKDHKGTAIVITNGRGQVVWHKPKGRIWGRVPRPE